MANEEQVRILRQGVEPWNQWRAGEGKDITPDLSGADLWEVNLSGANLSGVNLSNSTLRDVNLIEANLDQANLLGANLEGANLTGACIQDWNINSETVLTNIQCDFIYKKLTEDENKLVFTDRIPNDVNATFKPREFEALVRKAVDTIDLIFLDGIDWKAFLQSFNGIVAQYPDDSLAVQGIERKSEQFIIRSETTAPPENRGAIEASFKESYQRELASIEAKYVAELKANEISISNLNEQLQRERLHYSDMLEISKLLASRPTKIEVKAVAESDSRNITQGDHGRYNEMHDSSIYVEGDYYNSPQAAQDLTELATEIRQLLERLEQTFNPNTPMGKMEITKAAVENIKSTLSLKERVIKVIKTGSTAALESALNHPAASFIINAYKE